MKLGETIKVNKDNQVADITKNTNRVGDFWKTLLHREKTDNLYAP